MHHPSSRKAPSATPGTKSSDEQEPATEQGGAATRASSLDFSNLPVYLTPAQAAKYLGLTATCERPVNSFLKWVERNHIPKLHRGRRLLFRRADLDLSVEGYDFLEAAVRGLTRSLDAAAARARRKV